MGLAAAIIGGIGGLCAIMGILIAVEVIPEIEQLKNLDYWFWFALSAILLLGSIALSHGSSGGGGGGGYD